MQVSSGPPTGVLILAVIASIPIVGIMGWTAVKILGPIGQALSRRIAGGTEAGFLEQRVEALTAELDEVKHQLAETHERLDFTERLLAQERTPEQLRRGPST